MTTFVTILLLAALVFNTDAALNDLTIDPIAAPSPTLKPATPIAGTNILLNIPYKWHDFTKPGCYVTKIGSVCNVWVVCTLEDQQYYDTSDATWVLERTEGSESTNEYNGPIKIRNLGTKNAVGNMLPYSRSICLHSEEYENKWIVRPDPSDKNNMAFEPDNYNYWATQAAMSQPHRYSLDLETGRAPVYQYTFVSEIKLEANMYSFEFTEPPSGAIEAATSKKDLIDAYFINNNSSSTVNREIRVSEKITNEFAWGLSESFKTFAKVTGQAGIPFLASTEVETGFEFELSSNQNWKSSEEKTFEMSYSVDVTPFTIVKISAWYDLTKDISMDYTSETEITGKGSRITVYDDVIDDSPATGEMIRKYLEYTKFDGTVVQIKDYSVITRVKGIMTASVGLRGQLNVDGKPVDTVIVPT